MLMLKQGIKDLGANRLYCWCEKHPNKCWRTTPVSQFLCGYCEKNCGRQKFQRFL